MSAASTASLERAPEGAPKGDSSTRSFWRVLNGSMVGAVLEWYDFAVYGALAATVFAGQFFPTSDPTTGTLLAFGTQAVGFVARPLGGLVFGHMADRRGRKPTLIATYLLLGVATACIGFLPGYASWGLAAPIVLVVLRLIQGFALGGEFGAAVTLVSEHAAPRRRGWWCSLPQTGGPAGTLLATGALAIVSALTTSEQYNAWGWRIAFLIAIPLLLVGAWLRRGVEESPTFVAATAHQRALAKEQAPILEALRHPVPILQGLGVRVGENVAFYIYTVFVLAYAGRLGFAKGDLLVCVTVAAACQLIGMLAGGALSDRVGRKPVMITAAIVLGAWAPAFFALAQQRQLGLLYLGVCFGAFVHGLLAGPEAAWISELFPTRYRAAGTNVAVQGSSILGGGPAPLIATALLGASGNVTAVVIYLVVCALISVVSVATGPETKGRELQTIT